MSVLWYRAPPAALLLLFASGAPAQWSLHASQDDLKDTADSVLTLMAFTVLPDVTTSSLSIQDATRDDPGIHQVTLGGGFTLSEEYPLYLEGTLGAARYDPKYIMSRGAEQRAIPTKWNAFSATGGIGWDFPVTASGDLVFRPIFNFTLGRVVTDARIAQAVVESSTDTELSVIDGGKMDAYGLGGGVMLDYELVRPDHEIDIEARYTYIGLRTFGSTDEGLRGKSEANTAGIWARWRAPTGVNLLQRPLRYVLETSCTAYFDDQRGALGFDRLFSVGAGIELDSSAYPVVVTRTRLVGRYVFGQHVSGFSVGLAVSF